MKNGLDEQYIDLLKDILENGIKKDTRNGKVLSVFGRTIRYKFKDGKFPLLTTKKMYFKGIVTELLWFLRSDTSIKYLLENDCNIWTGDAFRNYWECNKIQSNPKWLKPVTYSNGNVGAKLYNIEEFINKIKTDDEFAKKWGELGPIYGKQWRSWDLYDFVDDEVHTIKIDQIANLINDLKTNPDSRRLMVSAWNVGELDQMVLPPCHYGFQVYTRELDWNERVEIAKKTLSKETFHEYGNLSPFTTPIITLWLNQYNIPTRAISLMWNQRSVDFGLGAPFNIASYGLLLGIIAKEVNMVPDELIGNLGDVHLYLDHIEPIKEQLNREPYPLPTLKIEPEVKWNEGDCLPYYSPQDFTLENYQSHPTIKLPLSN
jgi:thymidylate synthase